jgi:phosphoglycolate phosphatase-like HAD superfamily hydrolase
LKLILFDIDGTLVLTGGAGARAMARAVDDVWGQGGGASDRGRDWFGSVPMNGRTDAWIIAQMATAHGFTCDEQSLQRFHDVYVAHLAEEVHRPGPRKGVMPGVRMVLDHLADRKDVYMALLTGNLESGARVKLEYFDLWRYFPCGAFGDGAHDRNGLLPKALERVKASGGPEVDPSSVVIAGGTRSLAVATGSHDIASLRASGADAVLPDLSDLQSVLGAMGLR